jgi:periplasmic protein TonB
LSVTARVPGLPWRRLAWIVPAAFAVTALEIALFIFGLTRPSLPRSEPRIITVRFVELPPSPPSPVPEAKPQTPEPAPPVEVQPSPTQIETKPPPRLRLRTLAKPTPRPITHPQTSRQEAREAAMPNPVQPAPSTLSQATPSGGTMGARAIDQPMPEIPEELRHRHLSMVAVARFHVAVDGSAEIELIDATADPRLNQALLEALKKWRFFPAMTNGAPIASTIDIRIPIEVR